MKTIIRQAKVGIISLQMLATGFGCVKDKTFKPSEDSCTNHLIANTTFAEVKALYTNSTIQIVDDLILEGYVISSDHAGNFFGELHVQDSSILPSEGLQIALDLRDVHLTYPPGTRIFVMLKGLYLGKSKSIYKLGGVFNAFGNETVGRLPAKAVKEHLFVPCTAGTMIEPFLTTIGDIDDRMINTLIKVEQVEVIEEQIDLPYAISEEETKRTITDCEDASIVMLNSGFSDFHQEKLPSGNGSLTGVLTKESGDYTIVIRDTTDIDFRNERCKSKSNEVSSEFIFISELADPDNNNKARFLELYNSSDNTLILDGWTLQRYTNDNTEVSSVIDLSGFTIEAKSTLVIAANPDEFRKAFGFDADLSAPGNTAANSNGDDNIALIDPFDKLIDLFGVIGEDGSGTNHEFEDGKALRNPDVSKANPVFNFNEWTIYNDTGAMETIMLPKNAPEDFNPGQRN